MSLLPKEMTMYLIKIEPRLMKIKKVLKNLKNISIIIFKSENAL